MEDWSWLTEAGNVGELPVQILENSRAKFILDFAEGARISNYVYSGPEELSPGDVCVMNGKILEATQNGTETVLEVKAIDVEMIQAAEKSESDEEEGAGKQSEDDSDKTAIVREKQEGDLEVQNMMKHLDAARNRRKREKDASRCSNCRTVTGSTDVTIEEQVSGRDLHYCGQCNRLLSTKEYQQWKNENHW